jgi:molybdate transport system substrate-binding protein
LIARPWAWLLMIAFLLPATANAADIRVVTAGAFKSVLSAVAPGFEQRTGHHVLIETDTAGGVAQRIARGEAFDLAVLTPATAAAAARDGRITQLTKLAAVGIGVAVKEGAPLPDISTVAALKASLLAARAVALVDPAAGGTSGIYLTQLFERWGIAGAMRPKLVLVPGGLAAERILRGEADMALQQRSELIAVPGVVLVGLIPEEVQSQTVYVAGLNPNAGEPARALLAALAPSQTAAVLEAKGMTGP